MVTKLRRDDRPLLDMFASALGMGSVVDVAARPPDNPACVWTVCARAELLDAVQLLDAAGLLGRKRRQYEVWRPAALEVAKAAIEGRAADSNIVAKARRALRAASAYAPPAPNALPVEDRAALARAAYVEVLRRWSEGHQGKFTCTAYERYRQGQHGLPKRDTLTRAFGSWRAALRAAELG
jgi:hypothetical protein